MPWSRRVRDVRALGFGLRVVLGIVGVVAVLAACVAAVLYAGAGR